MRNGRGAQSLSMVIHRVMCVDSEVTGRMAMSDPTRAADAFAALRDAMGWLRNSSRSNSLRSTPLSIWQATEGTTCLAVVEQS